MKLKKTLSVLLCAALLFSTLAAGSTALAAENAETVTVEFSVYDQGVYTMEPTELTVSADLSDKYSDKTGYNDSSSQPTVLDATIAAHIAMFGEDFSDYAPLSVSGGWITASFGETASPSYRLNGATDDGNGTYYGMDTEIKTGDYIDYMYYQDSSYLDKYVSFGARDLSGTPGSVTLSLTAEGYEDNKTWNYVTVPAAGLTVYIDGEEAGTSDENGQLTVSLKKCGTFVLSASGTVNGTPIFEPYSRLTLSTDIQKKVAQQTQSSAQYQLKSKSSVTVSSACDFLTYLNSGYDMSQYKDAFVESVKNALSENDGKLVYTVDYTTNEKAKDLALYAAVIQSLEKLGYDPENFDGYNLVSDFESTQTTSISNPYYYRVAIEAADEDFAKQLCDTFIANYYTLGSGMNYYGYSCDNTAVFLTSIAKYADSYSDYVADAKKVLASYTTDGGAYYSSKYNNVNADSTALCLMAYSALGDVDTAFTYYKNLVEGFELSTDGVFMYDSSDTSYNEYATKESLLALEYFYNCIVENGYEHQSHVVKDEQITPATTKSTGKIANGSIKEICTICGETASSKTICKIKSVTLSTTQYTYNGKVKKPSVVVKDFNGNTVSSKYYTVSYPSGCKNVGKYAVKITFKGNYSGFDIRYFKINPKGTSISKLTAGKKAFTVKWNKQKTQTNGYQIQYSTSSKFKNAKTVTVSKNSTTSKAIKKLSAKKKYYVRIRTYKTVGKTKYYSSWSKAKTVKTK